MAIDKTTDQFLLDAYKGKGGFASGEYLTSHPREGDEKIKLRKELAVYPNYVKKILNVYLGFLWKSAPNRQVGGVYDKFCKNADGSGTTIDNLMFSYQRLAMILGTVYVIVDRLPNSGTSRADQSLPYCAVRLPAQLVAEEKDSQNVWLSVTFSEKPGDDEVYRTYTRQGWKVSADIEGTEIVRDKDGQLLHGEYKIGRVPVVMFHCEEPLEPGDSRADAWIYDLAQLNWDLYNVRSEKRELFRAQTFAILTLPVTSDKERQALQDLTISTENALTYNPVSGGKPDYVAPPATPIELYQKDIAEIIEEIYRVANLEFVGGVQQSGVALSFHFQEANSSMLGLAGQAELTEMDIARLVFLWEGDEFDGHIAYPSDFNLRDLAEAIAIALDSVTLGMGKKFDQTIKKRLSRTILANDTDPDVMTAIDDEIDAEGDEYGDRVRREAEAGTEVDG